MPSRAQRAHLVPHSDPVPPKPRLKRSASSASGSSAGPAPKKGRGKGKGKEKEVELPKVEWPKHFVELEKTFKALNTVIAFCSTRRTIAVTFNQIISSVEGLLKRPLELFEVAQIKALLPDIVRFAYIEHALIRVHLDSFSASSSGKGKGKAKEDVYAPPEERDPDAPDHVLILEFTDGKRAPPKKDAAPESFSHHIPVSPAETLKLIAKRNERFETAVNELLAATQNTPDDPVELLLSAAADHLPVQPASASKKAPAAKAPARIPGVGQRASVEALIEECEAQEWYKDQILHREVFEAREPTWGEIEEEIPESVKDALMSMRGVDRLYSHQARAIAHLASGKSVIVSTSTASGKSLVYMVPVLRALLLDRNVTAFFIYPTKALAQDQKGAVRGLVQAVEGLGEVMVETFDGDSPRESRDTVREVSSVIFTNFDTLHHSILPREDSWRRFLGNLRYVVVDELHYYNGVHGTHAALIMRRLRRLCAAMGNTSVQFVSASATIGNPIEHFEKIFGVPNVQLVDEDGSPSGRKDFLIWKPPLIDELQPTGPRVSPLAEASQLLRFLVARGTRTIVFCKHRKVCEHLMKTVRADLTTEGRTDIAPRIMSYRGGYNQADRRRIEQELFTGHLLGVIATSALELGIDVGSLDAVICLGFPYSLASLRQQTGRAGRTKADSLAVLIAEQLPLDSFYAAHPKKLFTRPPSDLVVDLSNEVVLESHLQCAADELPVSLTEDVPYFGDALPRIARDKLEPDAEGWYHTNARFKPFPAQHVSIRGGVEAGYTVYTVGADRTGRKVERVLEVVEDSRAVFELYEGGVFMNAGFTHEILEVSHDEKTARVRQVDVNWTTTPRDFTDIDPIETYRVRAIRDSASTAYYGKIRLRTVVFGFFKLRHFTILDVVDLDTPPYERYTKGLWLDVPVNALHLMTMKNINPAEAIQAAQYALLSLTPLYSMSSSGDIRTEEKNAQKEYAKRESQRKRPARLILFDAAGSNSGVCAKAFDHISALLHRALQVLEDCPCEHGCPSCIYISQKDDSVPGSKFGALVVLSALAGRPMDPDSVPDQLDKLDPRTPGETVVPAEALDAEGIVVEEPDVDD